MHTFKLFAYLACYFGLIFFFREKSQTEDEASGQVSSPPTTQPDGVTGDVQESDNRGTEEKVTTEEELSQEESDNILPVAGVSSEDCGDEEEDELLLTTSNKIDQDLIENDIQFSTDKDISQSELDNNVLLSLGNSMRDMSAEELGAIEHDEDPTIEERETALADDEIRATSDDQNTTDTEKATEEFPYSGLADVDVCAGELQQTYNANAVDEDLNASIAMEEELPGDSLLSQSRPPTASLQEMEPQEKKTLENREQTETHSGDAREFILSTEDAGHHMQEIEKILDTDDAPQEEGLVEINFDDVPELPEIIETEYQQSGDECSVVEQSEQRSESQSRADIIIRAESGHGEDGVQNIDEPTSETERQEKEVVTDGEERDDHKAADISMEMDASDLDFSNACYEGGLNETILSGRSSAETTNLEIKTDFDNDHETDNEDASEAENQGNKGPEQPLNTYNETEDPPEDTIEDEMREISGEVIEDTLTGLFSEMEEELPSEFDDVNAGRKSNISKPEKEAEEEEESENVTVEESPVEMKERPLTPMEPQPEDTMEETEDTIVVPQTTGADDQPEEVAIDDEGQGRSSALGEGSIESYHLTAGWAQDDISEADQRPPETEKDVVNPETEDDDKVTLL